jgi:hypothetical protein
MAMGLVILLLAVLALIAGGIGLMRRINPREGRAPRRFGIAGKRLYPMRRARIWR